MGRALVLSPPKVRVELNIVIGQIYDSWFLRTAILVTSLDTFQSLSGWLKESAPLNIYSRMRCRFHTVC